MVAQVVDVIEVAGHRQHPDRTAQPMQAGLGRAGEPQNPATAKAAVTATATPIAAATVRALPGAPDRRADTAIVNGRSRNVAPP